MDNSGTVTPHQLQVEITQLIAQETGCTGTWEQHKAVLTANELIALQQKITNIFSQRKVAAYLVEAGDRLK